MKNVFSALMMGASILLGAVFSSCQNDVADLNISQKEAKEIDVTLTAVMDNFTRASLDTQEDSDIIYFSWSIRDKIYVINKATGARIGILEALPIKDNPRKCDFSGTIKDPGAACSLYFYYIGNKGTMEVVKNEQGNFIPENLTVDFTTQKGSNLTFADYDILTGEHNYPDGINGNLQTVKFNRYLSFGRYKLRIEDDDVPISSIKDGRVKISAKSETDNLYNQATINFRTCEWTTIKANDTNGEISLDLSDVEDKSAFDFYLNLVPSPKVTLKFECSVNGEDFVGEIMTKIGTNLYYTNDNAGNPIPVIMKRADGSDDQKTFTLNYHQNLFGDYTEVKTVSESTTAISKEFTLDYSGVGFSNTPASDKYTFSYWATDNGGNNKVTTNSYTLTYDASSANKQISDDLYAIYIVNYKVSFDLEGATGTKPNDVATSLENTKTTSVTLPSGDGITKPNQKFIGWKEQGTDSPVKKPGESWVLSWEKPQIVLVPVWDQDKVTVSSTDYETMDIYGN